MKICAFMLAGWLAVPTLGFSQTARMPAKAVVPAPLVASLAAATHGLQKFDGYFPFYYDAKTGKILLEISRLNEEFLYFGSLASGVGNGIERGQSTAKIAKFVRVGGKVLLLEPNYDYRASGGNADEQRAVDNAFAKSVIWGFVPLVSEGAKVLIDLTPFLVRDSQKIGERLSSGGFSGPGTSLLIPGAGARPAATFKLDESRSAVYLEIPATFLKILNLRPW